MNITVTKYTDLEVLENWFPDKQSSYFWCGPGLRNPFTHESFLEDIHWQKMPTYSLLDEEQQLIGFGQYYEKMGRCHLARLVMSPSHRCKGIGRKFIAQLMNMGMQNLDTQECSLFVARPNVVAVKCYRSLGFEIQNYPPNHDYFEDIDFMVYKNTNSTYSD